MAELLSTFVGIALIAWIIWVVKTAPDINEPEDHWPDEKPGDH